VPKPLVALMSALRQGEPVESDKGLTYSFVQPVPMSSYLVALAVGALHSKPVGPRSLVWAEKETLDSAVFEVSELSCRPVVVVVVVVV